MKTIINKITKKIILPLAVAGIFGFNSYSQTTELEKYNQENKELHRDFMKFCSENSNKKEFTKLQYEISLPNYSIFFYDDLFGEKSFSIETKNGDLQYRDYDGDGLNDKSIDAYSFIDKKTDIEEIFAIKDLSPEEQLAVAKEYTTSKRRILHDANYNNY